MLHKKLTYLIIMIFFTVVVACSPTAPDLVEPADTQTDREPVLQPADGEDGDDAPAGEAEGVAEDTVDVEPPAEEESTDSGAPAGEVAGLPLLPALPPSQSGGFGGGGGVATTAESTSLPIEGGGGIGDERIFEPFNPFENTVFVLNASLPADIAGATVYQQPAVFPDPAAAFEMANRLGFQPPLYQEVLPAEVRQDIQQLGEGIYRLPFFAVRNNEWLTIMSGSAFYENRSAFNRFNGEITLPFDQARGLAEQQITAWGGLNFEYTIVDQGFGNVLVQRLLNGQPLDYPELYFQFENDGRLVYASYNVLSQLNPIGDYPLIPPQAAWEKIQGGVIENNIWYSYVFDPTLAVAEPAVLPVEPDIDFQFWQRTYEPGDEIRYVGYPQIYLPVQSDGLPLVLIDQYQVIGPQELFFDLIADRPFQIMVEGTVGQNGRTIEMRGWESAEDIEPLFLEGTLFREDMGMVLQTIDNQTFMLLDVPEDVENGLEVYVFGWQAIPSDLFAFPVLDWVNIDKRVEFPDEGEIALPEPGIVEEYDPNIAEVQINEITLGYLYVAQWPEFAETDVYVQPDYDLPPVFLQPFWQFSGTNEKGERMTFSVPAVDPTYFQQ